MPAPTYSETIEYGSIDFIINFSVLGFPLLSRTGLPLIIKGREYTPPLVTPSALLPIWIKSSKF